MDAPAHQAPPWFLTGTPVPDIYARSSDAPYILDADFAEDEGIGAEQLEWRECVIPVDQFELSQSTMEAHIAALIGDRCGKERAEELERCERIERWINEAGGIDAAFQQSPLLMTIKEGKPKLKDGYHRLGLAIFTFGATSIRALCAELPRTP